MQVVTVDHRMQSLVAAFGNVPADARRLQDAEAQEHGATWIRRMLGKGIACHYVIAYQHGERWWSFCFEREPELSPTTPDGEVWTVEAYDSDGKSWCGTFQFHSQLSLWERRPDLPEASAQREGYRYNGDDCGRDLADEQPTRERMQS
jgi:hypothetical protein